MGFEAPLALLALALAGLPIVAHLLRRQDLPRIKLPTVMLLRRAEAASRRRVRLVDLLLLIVRVLLIAAAAIALSAPFLRVTLAYGDGSIASVAIVVDDSMSLGGRGDPTVLAEAIERASAVVDSLPAGSEIAIVLGGAPARVLVPRTDRIARARAALDDLSAVSARGTDLSGAIALAERELAGARNTDRRMIVLSDFAAHAEIAELPSSVDIALERVGEEADERNAAVVDARATPDPTTPGRSSVAIEIRARGMDGEEIELVLRASGEELARQRVTIERGGARATLNVRADRDEAGVVASIEVDDAIDADDERGFLVRPNAGARVLVVAGEPNPGRDGDEARFLTRAIDLAPAEGGALTRRRVDAETFAAMDLAEADVIVLSNVTAPSERNAQRLREHVERGGGLLIAPGDHFDPRAYAARLGDLLPARPSTAVESEIGGPHAAPGSYLVPAGSTGLDASRTRRRLTLEGTELDAPLRFADETPAIALGRSGDGRVAILATTLDDAWTDFPYRPGYLPAIVSLLRRLAPRGSTAPGAAAPGASVSLEAPAGSVRMRVLTPDGQRLEWREDDLEAPVEITETHAPGVYRVEIASRERELHAEPRLAFVVSPPPEESDLAPGPMPEAPRGSEHASATSTVQRPLAPWFFLFVGLLAIVEAAIRLRASHLARAPSSLGPARA